jgi:hypothetical protein
MQYTFIEPGIFSWKKFKSLWCKIYPKCGRSWWYLHLSLQYKGEEVIIYCDQQIGVPLPLTRHYSRFRLFHCGCKSSYLWTASNWWFWERRLIRWSTSFLHSSMYLDLSLGVIQLEHVAEHSPPCSVCVKNVGRFNSCTPYMYVFRVWCKSTGTSSEIYIQFLYFSTFPLHQMKISGITMCCWRLIGSGMSWCCVTKGNVNVIVYCHESYLMKWYPTKELNFVLFGPEGHDET